MSTGEDEIANKILCAPTARDAKKESKEIPQKDAWDIIKVDVMQQLIHQKVRSCTEFKECLIDSDNKVLIEATTDDFWASGLNVNITKYSRK